MRRIRSGLATLAIAGVATFVVVTGCSASGSDASVDPDAGAGDPPPTSQVPPSGGETGDDGSTPPPKKDAGKDTGADAGPPPPTPGTPCSQPNKVVAKECGACGTQSTVCLVSADAGADAGSGTWTAYSACEGELPGGCVPGATASQPCGNCGTQAMTCSKFCAWTPAACVGQPVDSCVPLTLDFSIAGCAGSNAFRQRSCKADCTWTNFSTSCSTAPAVIQVPPTIGASSSTIVTLTSTKTILALTGDTTCPTAGISATDKVPYEYVQIHNPNAKKAFVTIYNSLAPGGVVFHTNLASYAGAAAPQTPAARKACMTGMNVTGDDTITGDMNFASLTLTDAPTIPPHGDITIYNSANDKFDPAKPTASTGSVKLTVQLDDLQ